MGVEPTVDCSAQPTTDFEDRGIHRDTFTPTGSIHFTVCDARVNLPNEFVNYV